MTNTNEREKLRLEASALREDIFHLSLRVEFFTHWKSPTRLSQELKSIQAKIDVLEGYAEKIVEAHDDKESVPRFEKEIEQKKKRLRECQASLHGGEGARENQVKTRNPNRDVNRVGCLSEEKSVELARNMGMSVEQLQEILKRAKVKA